MSDDTKFGLWERTSASGYKYLNGKILINGEEYWLSVMKNSFKKTDKHPACNAFIKPVNGSKPLSEHAKADEQFVDTTSAFEDVDDPDKGFPF